MFGTKGRIARLTLGLLATGGMVIGPAATTSAAKPVAAAKVPVCRVDGAAVVPDLSSDRIADLQGIVRKLVDQGVRGQAVPT